MAKRMLCVDCDGGGEVGMAIVSLVVVVENADERYFGCRTGCKIEGIVSA
jgi:hypothetical protein